MGPRTPCRGSRPSADWLAQRLGDKPLHLESARRRRGSTLEGAGTRGSAKPLPAQIHFGFPNRRFPLLLLFVLVVAAAQFATYFIVSRGNRTNARAFIEQDLRLAGADFRQIVAERNDILATGAGAATSDYVFKQLFARASDAATITSALNNLQGQFVINVNELAAASLLVAIPTMVVYLIFQRQFVRGLTLGATKG